MPLYEYECPTDGVFELVRKFSDPPLAACPKCGGPVEKLASAPAIQFKGTGWYVTDYARKSDGGRDKAASAEKGASSEKKAGESSSGKDSGTTSSGSSSGSASSGGDNKASSGGVKKSGGEKK